MLPPPVPGTQQNYQICPNCRRQIMPTWNHCGYCGFPLPSKRNGRTSRPSQTGQPTSRGSKSTAFWVVGGILTLGLVVVAILIFAYFNFFRLPETSTLQEVPASTPRSHQARTQQAAAALPAIEPTQTATELPTLTPTQTITPLPTFTPTPQGIAAVIPSPSQWQCLSGPGDTVYTSTGIVDSKNVMITGKDNSKSWFRVVSINSGQVCWVPIVSLDRSNIDTNAVPVIEDPEPPGTIYFGYKYAVCGTGWLPYNERFIQCRAKPACYIYYPTSSKAFTSSNEALSACQSSGGSTTHCSLTIPYTIAAVDTGTLSTTCSISRVDHSETDINYELYWLNLP